MVASNWALVAPVFSATAKPWIISGESSSQVLEAAQELS